jgi:hypothetical protein
VVEQRYKGRQNRHTSAQTFLADVSLRHV